MAFKRSSAEKHAFTLRAMVRLVVTSALLAVTSCQADAGRQAAGGGRTPRSHLTMWLQMEHEVIPGVTQLARAAHVLLRCTCAEETKRGEEECRIFAASLPNITERVALPSLKVMRSERRKIFAKNLAENTLDALEEVRTLVYTYVSAEGLGNCLTSPGEARRHAERFIPSLDTTLGRLRDVMTSFYKRNGTGAGVAAGTGDSQQILVDKARFHSERQRAIKVLHVAVERLRLVASVLEYLVELSWFARLADFYLPSARPGM